MESRLQRLDPRIVVPLAAVLAAALRFPGALYPVGPDESGYTLVARHWDPAPDSVYGPYFVDRPPPLIALFGLADAVGGPGLVRVVGAVGCAVLVLLAAATARAMLRDAGVGDARFRARTGAWTAVLTAAFAANAMIDPVMVKGELLGIPWVVASFWLAIRALERRRLDRWSVAAAFGAGFTATTALGMKQNLFAGLVFGAVLLVGARVAGRITTRTMLGLAGSAVAGAWLPVAACVAWAVSAGVRLETLWYAVYGFRADALAVLAASTSQTQSDRAWLLAGIVVATGMGFVVAGVLVNLRRLARIEPTLLTATAAVLLVDLAGLLLGGSFWRQYLFALVPGLVLCAALLLAARAEVERRVRVLVVFAAATSMVSSVLWVTLYQSGFGTPVEVHSGEAIGEAARPGDTIMVYGGHAELVLASGLAAPYPHLWSLPMRTLDPELEQLRRLLAGDEAPTWVVMQAPGYSWDGFASPIRPVLDRRYDVHGRVCNGRYVYLREGVDRPPLRVECD